MSFPSGLMSLAGAADTAAMALLVLFPALSKSGCCHCRPRMATPAPRRASRTTCTSVPVPVWVAGSRIGREGEKGRIRGKRELKIGENGWTGLKGMEPWPGTTKGVRKKSGKKHTHAGQEEQMKKGKSKKQHA